MKSSAILWFLGIVALAAGSDPWPNDPWPNDQVTVNNCGSGGCCGQNGRKGGRIWLIGIDDNYGTLDTTDDNNSVTGWGEAVIRAACRAAGIQCAIVYVPGSDCLISDTPTYKAHVRLGTGLLNGAIDACHSWFATRERQDVGLFSDGYFADIPYFFWYIGGAPGGSQNSLRIGWAPGPGDEICFNKLLAANGITPNNNNQLVWYSSIENALNALNAGSIDLVFENEREATLFGGALAGALVRYDLDNDGNNAAADTNDQRFCSLAPVGLLTRKDRWDLIELFNIGLRRIKDNGVFRAICEDAQWDQSGSKTAWHVTWCTQDY